MAAFAVMSAAAAVASGKPDEPALGERRDVPYVDDGDVRHLLDVRYPVNATGFPTVVFFHGGGLVGGSKAFIGALDPGIAQVTANYRLMNETNGVRGADCIADAAAAVAWTLENIGRFGGDPRKVYVSGSSAGGYLTMMVGMDPRWLARHGRSNRELAGLVPLTGQATAHFNVRKFSGDTSPRYVPKVDELSPLRYVSKDIPPILAVAGEPGYELLGRSEENELLIASCRALGHRKAWYVRVPFADHGRASRFGKLYLEIFVRNGGAMPAKENER